MLDSSQTQQIAKVPVRVTVELGRQRIPLAQLCQLVPGSVFSLSIPAATQVKLLAGKKTLAEGEVVRTGTTLGFRFEGTDAAPASRERIAS